MSQSQTPQPGTITWTDLTVEHADIVRDFYKAVVGWQPEPVEMGSYDDFSMVLPSSRTATAGICRAPGVNADLPAQWLVYITVVDLDRSMQQCRHRGGSVIVGPRTLGKGRFCVIRDPARAVAALFMPDPGTSG